MNANNDYYGILQVKSNARQGVIHAAYIALMKEYMPSGSNLGDEESAVLCNAAYEILSNPEKRSDYDQLRFGDPSDVSVLGDYRVIRFIAEGSIGRTYLAEHKLVEEQVCIKQCIHISPEAELILLEEAKMVWDLRHYALPAMRDVVRLEDDSLAIIMSYIPGPTLQEVVEKVGRLEPEHVAWIAERVLNALSYMHLNGVIHGDVKPNNLIIQPEKHMAVLVDFGLSMQKPTRISESKGFTEHFAPPEAMRVLPLIPQSDLYSLGITMLYALCGDSTMAGKRQIPNSTPAPLKEFIQRLVRREALSRPSWENEDLCATIKVVRERSFGRKYSNLKPIKGL